MKKTIAFLILFWFLFQAFSQNLTYDNFKSLIPYLKVEDWKSAYIKSSKLLKSSENDTSEFRAIIVYINIYSAAGMVSQKQMSYKTLEKNIMKFKGQKIIMSAHPVTSKEGAFNQVKFEITDSTNAAVTTVSNSSGTSIFCFEKFIFKDSVNTQDYPERSFVRCGGTLENIELNPNQSLFWIVRLTVSDAFVRKSN
jgi:hypothetical protein